MVTKEADMGTKGRKPATAPAEESVASRGAELPEARAIIGAFIARYNAEWLIERLGHRTPSAARAAALAA